MIVYNYLLNNVLDAPSFIQRMAEHTGVTDKDELSTLVQLGLQSGDLSLHRIGAGEDARLFIANDSIARKGNSVSRLIRTPLFYRRRSAAPSGQLMLEELSPVYRKAVDYLSQQWFRPNGLILDTLSALADEGHFDKKMDQMELLMLGEFRPFGVDPYLLPMFPDSRYRVYTDSRGIASYQGGDWHRAICDFAESKPVTDEDIHYALRAISDEYGVTEDNYREILADPLAFIKAGGKKPACSLRAAEAIREMKEDKATAYILQQDQSNSGAALYAWFTGDRNLARLTNFLPSKEKQDLYGAAGQLVRAAGLLPTQAAGCEQFYCRSTGKTFIVPMIYGAANESLTRSMFLKDPQKDRISFVDPSGCYIPGSLDEVPTDRLNASYIDFLRELGWSEAVRVASDIARAYETAVYGSDTVRGLTTRLRPAMTSIKRAARLANAKGTGLSWTSPSGCVVHNHKLKVDRDSDPEQINITNGGVRYRVSFMKVSPASSDAAAPPNVIHSVDGSVVHISAGSCCDEGIALAPIHDSFGTHVCDARRVKSIVRESIAIIPQDFLDKQVFEPNGLQPLGYEPLPIKEFMKAEHFLG